MRSAQEQQVAVDPLQLEKGAPALLMENVRVRVLKGCIRAGDKAAMHFHPDNVVYVLKGGKLQFTYPTGDTETMDLLKGRAFYMEAQSHEVVNVGDTDLELIIVELK